MPGFHLAFGINVPEMHRRFTSSLSTVCHDCRYAVETIASTESSLLAFTRYPEYPVVVYKRDGLVVALEGCIYNRSSSQLKTDLFALADHLISPAFDGEPAVRDWLLSHDGEYVVIAVDTAAGRWGLVNDALGRLPLFCRRRGDGMTISREVGLYAHFPDSPTIDRNEVSQYLLFGFIPGGGTCFEGVHRLPPSTVVRWHDGLRRIETRTVCGWRYDQREEQTVTQAAERLAALFVQACRDRTSIADHSLVALSGGLDSRMVAIGVSRAKAAASAATFSLPKDGNETTVRVAEQVAGALGMPWESVAVPNSSGVAALGILNLKWGLVSPSQGFDYPFFEHLRQRWGGRYLYLSGDGGWIMPAALPRQRVRTVRALSSYIIERLGQMPLGLVARLTGLRTRHIAERLEAVLESYPEQPLSYRYIHFMLAERERHWLYEGEDRNRCDVWCTTPFYAIDFYRAAMACPEPIKRDYRMYRELMARLSPEVAVVPNANWGVPITSPKHERRLKRVSMVWRFPRVGRLLRDLLRPPPKMPDRAPAVSCLRRQVESCPAIEDYLDLHILKRICRQPGNLNAVQFEAVLTMASVVELATTGESTLASFTEDGLFVDN